MCEGCHGPFCELHHTNQPSSVQRFRSFSRLSRCLRLLRVTQGQEWLAPHRSIYESEPCLIQQIITALVGASRHHHKASQRALLDQPARFTFFPLSILSGSERSKTAFLRFCVERISPIKQAGSCVRRIAFLAAIPYPGFLRF